MPVTETDTLKTQSSASTILDLDDRPLGAQLLELPLNHAKPYLSLIPGECSGCLNKIHDRFYLVVGDRYWHASCLQCCSCHCSLESELSCFFRNDLVYCKEDYYRQFSVRCAVCCHVIDCKEYVMRAKQFTYHLHCFNCNVCANVLNPGDYFGLNSSSGLLYCQMHYEPLLLDSQMCTPDMIPSFATGIDRPNITNGSSLTKAGRPKKKKKMMSNASTSAMDDSVALCMMLNSANADIIGLPLSSHTRTKRMRTSFKHHQLKAMKAYFVLNHNPDAKDLKQLAQRTGLTKRVLQVWFQNARAKYRRTVQQTPTDGETMSNSNAEENGEGGTVPEDPTTSRSSKANEEVESDSDDKCDNATNCSSLDGTADPLGNGMDMASLSSNDDSNQALIDTTSIGLDISAGYSPQISAESEEDTASKALAEYFHHCDNVLM